MRVSHGGRGPVPDYVKIHWKSLARHGLQGFSIEERNRMDTGKGVSDIHTAAAQY